MKSGVLNLYKERGMTSHDAVARVRRLYGTKKVGHTGTLDPEAEGVLPILVGGAVKASEFFLEGKKEYRATVRFGFSTDTEDIWGRVTEQNGALPAKEDFVSAVNGFPEEYLQTAPSYSAVKVNGKKLYEYARLGVEVERPRRQVKIYSLTLLSFSGSEAELSVSCSKGTYIRTLLCDLCRNAGVLGSMSALCREKSGGFLLEEALRLEELEKMSPSEREEALLPTERLFAEYPVLAPAPFFARLIQNGCAVKAEKCGLTGAEKAGSRYRLYNECGFFALGELRDDPEGLLLFKRKDFSKE